MLQRNPQLGRVPGKETGHSARVLTRAFAGLMRASSK